MRIWRDLAAVGVLLLATRCAVSFKDYPVGDTHASAAGSAGLDASSGGRDGTTANGGGGQAGADGSGTGGTATGGSVGTGGSSATGGKSGTGGSAAAGGADGGGATGGVAGSGGNGVGGTSAAGGAGGTAGCTGTVDSDHDNIPDNCEQLLWSHEVKSDATGNYRNFTFSVLMGEKTMGGQSCGDINGYPYGTNFTRINVPWSANATQLADCMTDGTLDTVYFTQGASNQQVESDTESNYGMGNPDLAGHTITQFRLVNNSFTSDCTSSSTTCTIHYDETWQARGY